MSDNLKLLPCPFCGGEAVMEEVENAVGRTGSVCFSVGCNSHDEESCMGYQSLTTFSRRSDAAKAWNTRAVPADAAARDWQPISTAPKDGTIVDLLFRGNIRFTDCKFADGEWWACEQDEPSICVAHGPSQPTYWMPLPYHPVPPGGPQEAPDTRERCGFPDEDEAAKP
jgi:Restriction alleviation protein Lar